MSAPRPTLADLAPPNEAGVRYFRGPLDARAAVFSLTNAAWMADAAMLAYSEAPFADATFRGAGGMDAVAAYGHARPDVYSTQCYIAHRDDAIVVAFRGTEQVGRRDLGAWTTKLRRVLRDVAADAAVRLTPHAGGGRVHRGFAAAFEQVWGDVAAHLGALRSQAPPRSVWFTGHSLGAALATLAADRHVLGGGRVAGVYTFGSPSVGDAAFAERYAARRIPTYRVAHHHDVVARVPLQLPTLFPGGALPSYVPVGEPYFMTANGAALERAIPHLALGDWLAAPPGVSELRDLLRRPRGERIAWLLDRTPADRMTDHAPIYYASYLWDLAARA